MDALFSCKSSVSGSIASLCLTEKGAEYTLTLSKQLSIELYSVKTLDQVEIGRYLPTYQNDYYSKTISSKGLRPDIILLSRANLKIIVVELSIPFESQVDQSHEYKTRKYEDL